MKILLTICARGGSKGVPGKNTMNIGGKPLIAHTIFQALKSSLTDDVVVSSDSEDILRISKYFDAPFTVRRPPELAIDSADKLEAIRHAVNLMESNLKKNYDIIIDLDPTSPLRNVEDIIAAFNLFKYSDAENLISASPARRSPYFNLVEVATSGYAKLSKPSGNRVIRRQESPKCYDMNASIYIWKRNFLMENKVVFGDKTILFEMPEERSIDLDSPLDLSIIKMLMEEKEMQVINSQRKSDV